MKHNNIKIAILEEGNFYNSVIEKQVFDLCSTKQYNNLNWVIKSFNDPANFKLNSKNAYHAIIVDNYFKASKKPSGYNLAEVIERTKSRHGNCLFISLSGCREMLITAEYYKEGELQFYYSKQNNSINSASEENCSVPAIYKLMDRLVDSIQEQVIAELNHKKVPAGLRISA